MAKLNFKDLESNELILLIAPSEQMQQVNLKILRYFANEKAAFCVYLTVAKPYRTILGILEKNRIKTDRIFFIDCITSSTIGGEMERAGNCVFCPPQALTDISIALSTSLKSMPRDKERVLIIDTIGTLMLYNEAVTVSKFIHSLTAKLREWGIKSVIMTLEEETEKKVLAELGQFCDKVISIN